MIKEAIPQWQRILICQIVDNLVKYYIFPERINAGIFNSQLEEAFIKEFSSKEYLKEDSEFDKNHFSKKINKIFKKYLMTCI